MTYFAEVVFEDTKPRGGVLLLRPGTNLTTGEKTLALSLGALSSVESDFLNLAASIYACDLAFKRGDRERITRKIDVTIPVVNRAVFENAANRIKYALYRLSHDAWSINFKQRDGTITNEKPLKQRAGCALLFSGGLDSLAAGIEYGEGKDPLYLISHVTANRVVSDAQAQLAKIVVSVAACTVSHFVTRVGAANKATRGYPFPTDEDREETQRTRSFLFLTLGALAAKHMQVKKVLFIAENGQMAIHLPLNAARISAFSTHTAHPEFVRVMGEVCSEILAYDLEISNPYLYKTKAEVVKRITLEFVQAARVSVSCWKASRLGSSFSHCGFCIPCFTRRIALEANGLSLPEYKRDIFNEKVGFLPPDDEGKRNLMDLLEFISTFGAGVTQAELEGLYPDLVGPDIDAARAVAMYRRFAEEARQVFERYPSVAGLLP